MAQQGASACGFESWPKLKAYTDDVNTQQLLEAVRTGDIAQVRAMLKARPELAQAGIHEAVLNRAPEMVRLLMSHGASAREGIYPHRDATSALTIATERGYDEIVAIIRGETKENRNNAPEADGPLTSAVKNNQPEILAQLLAGGLDPDERQRVGNSDEIFFTWGAPLWHCAGAARYQMAEMLLRTGADPNARVYASGSPMFQAYSEADWKMVELLARHGGVPEATTAGLFRQTELARKMLAGEAAYKMDAVGGDTLAEQLLWGGACGGDPEIVQMALDRVDWTPDNPRWFTILEQPLRIWTHGSASANWDRGTYLTCFRLLLERCDPKILGRFGLTILHSVAGSRRHVTPEERVSFATMLLDRGARFDIRDDLLKSTPLGWACRWGRIELVALLLARGADRLEADAEPWATPRAWVLKSPVKSGRDAMLALLE